MKYLLISLLFIVGCAGAEPEIYYKAMSCNRDGCDFIASFGNAWGCENFINSIIQLHKLRGDKPTKVIFCKETR